MIILYYTLGVLRRFLKADFDIYDFLAYVVLPFKLFSISSNIIFLFDSKFKIQNNQFADMISEICSAKKSIKFSADLWKFVWLKFFN